MSHAFSRARIADVRVRWVMLLVVLAGSLPVPVVHAHDVADGTQQLALHVALFHAKQCDSDPQHVHVHLIPASFFGGAGFGGHGAGGATGDEAPGPEQDTICPPGPTQVDAPLTPSVFAQVVCGSAVELLVPATAPRHFLETYAAASDLGGLWGVCRC